MDLSHIMQIFDQKCVAATRQRLSYLVRTWKVVILSCWYSLFYSGTSVVQSENSQTSVVKSQTHQCLQLRERKFLKIVYRKLEMLKIIFMVLSKNRGGKSLQESNLSISKRASILQMPVVRQRAKLTWFYELTSLTCIPGKGGPFYLQQSWPEGCFQTRPSFSFSKKPVWVLWGGGIMWFKGGIEETRLDMCWSLLKLGGGTWGSLHYSLYFCLCLKFSITKC